MKEIAEELNGKGIRTTKGKKVSDNVVSRMLHNRKYIGEYRYKDIVNPNGIPAILPQELFDKVQRRIEETKKAPATHKADEASREQEETQSGATAPREATRHFSDRMCHSFTPFCHFVTFFSVRGISFLLDFK